MALSRLEFNRALLDYTQQHGQPDYCVALQRQLFVEYREAKLGHKAVEWIKAKHGASSENKPRAGLARLKIRGVNSRGMGDYSRYMTVAEVEAIRKRMKRDFLDYVDMGKMFYVSPSDLAMCLARSKQRPACRIDILNAWAKGATQEQVYEMFEGMGVINFDIKFIKAIKAFCHCDEDKYKALAIKCEMNQDSICSMVRYGKYAMRRIYAERIAKAIGFKGNYEKIN